MRRILTTENILRLVLMVVLVAAVHTLMHEKAPSRSSWGRHLAERRDPTFREQVIAGAWFAAAARAGISAVLLALSFTWIQAGNGPTGRGLRRQIFSIPETEPKLSGRFFAGAIILIAGTALALRLPRMTHSFWGDEADAVATYVHGHYVPDARGDLQGPLKFVQPTWQQSLFSGEHGPNNHVAFTLLSRLSLEAWRKAGGHAVDEFAEWPCRAPVLVAGLASLVLLPLLLARWGAPWTGLLASAFMALHPWHVRYSTEARGYGIMICLFVLLLHALTSALERNRWCDWLLFGLGEFLMMWSWAGSAYALVTLNLAVVILVIMAARKGENRIASAWCVLSRWLTSSLLAAGAFATAYLPILLQIQRVALRSGWMKGREMNAVWLHNLLAGPFTGIPFHAEDAANPAELSWQRLFTTSPVITAAGFTAIIALAVIGLCVLWRRSRPVALVLTAILLAMPLSGLHFYFVLKDELLTWYWFFTLPWLSVLIATGAVWLAGRFPATPPVRPAVAVLLTALACVSLWPMTRDSILHPTEDYRGATAASRGSSETFSPGAPSKVFTAWLWRFSQLYDPRGDIHVRDAPGLRDRMKEAAEAHGQLHVIVGYRMLAQSLNADMLKLLDDPALFDKQHTFWAQEALHTLTVYRMK